MIYYCYNLQKKKLLKFLFSEIHAIEIFFLIFDSFFGKKQDNHISSPPSWSILPFLSRVPFSSVGRLHIPLTMQSAWLHICHYTWESHYQIAKFFAKFQQFPRDDSYIGPVQKPVHPSLNKLDQVWSRWSNGYSRLFKHDFLFVLSPGFGFFSEFSCTKS